MKQYVIYFNYSVYIYIYHTRFFSSKIKILISSFIQNMIIMKTIVYWVTNLFIFNSNDEIYTS